MVEISTGKLIFIMAALNIFAIVAVLFGVFLGGLLVYKTKYSGAELFTRRTKPEEGHASAMPDEFADFDSEIDQLQDELFKPTPGSENAPTGDNKTEQALQNILRRNQDFMAKGGTSSTPV